jgi:ketosteroid isomerase-like protein
MPQENVEVVRAYFGATNEGDFARAMRYYAHDVELVVPGDAFLEGGRFKGTDAVGRWFGNWFRTFQPGYRFDLEEARDLGEVVLVVAGHSGRGRTSGAEVRATTGYLFRVRDGKIASVELYAGRGEALEAAGLSDRDISS